MRLQTATFEAAKASICAVLALGEAVRATLSLGHLSGLEHRSGPW